VATRWDTGRYAGGGGSSGATAAGVSGMGRSGGRATRDCWPALGLYLVTTGCTGLGVCLSTALQVAELLTTTGI
jgi:hypothetical protein